jgi:cellulose synthase/poly-beta-1,6-N-acetylglucosamine synthase-like glycosyltransferase
MSLQIIVLTLSMVLTLLFFLYGFNHYYLLLASRQYSAPHLPEEKTSSRERVSVHLPLYNEKYVVNRLIDACVKMAIEYGQDKVKIVIIDDSIDETTSIINEAIKKYREKQINIDVIRRLNREGFKAGALQAALEQAEEEFIAIFDADFIPPEDFLLRTMPYFSGDEKLGIIQCRWTHLNRDYDYLTRAISIGIDVHFLIEQAGRFAAGCFQNFNGSGGVLRKKAIVESGGWQMDTLAEDLDLSYRIQLKGYHVLYLQDLHSPAEVPPTVPSFKKQQGRWACGSLRAAKKILPSLLKKPELGLKKRFQAFIHLTGYIIHPLMLLSFLLICFSTLLEIDTFKINLEGLPLLFTIKSNTDWSALIGSIFNLFLWGLLLSLIFLCTIAALITPLISLRRQRLSVLANAPSLLVLFLLGCGVSLNNTIEAGKALFSNEIYEFKRTPKYAVHQKSEKWQNKHYQVPLEPIWILELAVACLGWVSIGDAILRSNFIVLLILIPYTSAFTFVLLLTIKQSRYENIL